MRAIYSKNNTETVMQGIYNFMESKKKISDLSIGYFASAVVISLDSLLNGSSLTNAFNKFWIFSATSVLIWASFLVIILFKAGKPCLAKYLRTISLDKRFIEIINDYTNKIFSGQEVEGYGWGDNKTFVASPYINKGLETKDVMFEFKNQKYDFDDLIRMDQSMKKIDFDSEYKEYMQKEFFQSFTYDSDRLMLAKRPNIYTDDNRISIPLKRVKWSQLQFFWNKVLTSDEQRKQYIDYYYTHTDILSPNSFCLHLVVLTADNKILLTQNAPSKFADYPNYWTASLGEQLDDQDIIYKEGDCAFEWVKRAFQEELALTEENFDKNDIRFISINCEGNVCNFSYLCIAHIKLTAEELDVFLRAELRQDNEFKDYRFLDINQIPAELIKPAYQYHPSTHLRLLYTFVNQKGRAAIKNEILKEKYKKQ